ncbi:MAG: hypothetical protein JSS50_04020 [Proteobacteria bacterium]|nr:hypothetical protein [Pseudomonadota bacterium]
MRNTASTASSNDHIEFWSEISGYGSYNANPYIKMVMGDGQILVMDLSSSVLGTAKMLQVKTKNGGLMGISNDDIEILRRAKLTLVAHMIVKNEGRGVISSDTGLLTYEERAEPHEEKVVLDAYPAIQPEQKYKMTFVGEAYDYKAKVTLITAKSKLLDRLRSFKSTLEKTWGIMRNVERNNPLVSQGALSKLDSATESREKREVLDLIENTFANMVQSLSDIQITQAERYIQEALGTQDAARYKYALLQSFGYEAWYNVVETLCSKAAPSMSQEQRSPFIKALLRGMIGVDSKPVNSPVLPTITTLASTAMTTSTASSVSQGESSAVVNTASVANSDGPTTFVQQEEKRQQRQDQPCILL